MTAEAPPDPTEQFESLAREARSAQDELTATWRALADGPDPELEARAVALLRRRDELLSRWGLVALKCMAAGGEVTLAMPETRAPIPERDFEEELPEDEALTEEMGDAASSDWLDEELTDEAPASDLDLARLRQAVLGPRWQHRAAPRVPTFDPSSVRALLKRVGEPAAPSRPSDAEEELARISIEVEGLDGWRLYPRGIQRALVGMFAARLRFLQDELPQREGRGLDRQKLTAAFPFLTRFSDEAQPGFVKGLGRGQSPDKGSWLEDARYWHERIIEELEGSEPPPPQRPGEVSAERALDGLRKLVEGGNTSPQAIRSAAILALDSGLAPDNAGLVRALKPHLDDLAGDGRLKALRRAVRQALAAEADEEETAAAPLPPDWPYLKFTRGKIGVIVGGDSRETARKTLQDALEFSDLTWERAYDIRAVQALAGRIGRGRVDFVIFLQRFISHKITDQLVPACKSAEVPWVMVEQGYGLTRVRLAMERYL